MGQRKSHKRKNADHTAILYLDEAVRAITSWPDVKSALTGPIRNGCRARRRLEIRVVGRTKTGLRCTAHSEGIQALYVVTDSPETVETKIEAVYGAGDQKITVHMDWNGGDRCGIHKRYKHGRYSIPLGHETLL